MPAAAIWSSRPEIENGLRLTYEYPDTGIIILRDGDLVWQTRPTDLGASIDIPFMTHQVLAVGRTGSILQMANEQIEATTEEALSETDPTHPYFEAIDFTVSTDTITLTANVAGVPFTATSSVSGGGSGTIGSVTTSTEATGPNHWDEAENWSTGAVPVSTDTVYIRASTQPICWGLDQSAVDLGAIFIDQTFTGKIGLRRDQFATSADAAATASSVPEYRQSYLDIGYDACDIGLQRGPGTANGSTRIKLDNDKAGASETRIHNTASAGESNKAAVLLLAANAGADVEVRNAPGGVGLATDEPGETSTFGDITVTDTTTTSNVYVGEGVTLSNWSQRGGANELNAAADITSVQTDGGTLLLEGDYTVTTFTQNGGTTTDNHTDGTAIITTLNLNGGTLDLTGRRLASRTITTVNHEGGSLQADYSKLVITTWNEPTSGLKQATVSDL